jgi:hypothetical protein
VTTSRAGGRSRPRGDQPSPVGLAAREAVRPLAGNGADGVPLVLCAHLHCTAAFRRFVARCSDPERRLLASHSIDLESSQLLSEGKGTLSWHGPAFVLVTPDSSPGQALKWAVGSVAAGTAAAVAVCEVDELSAEGRAVAATAVLVAAGTGPGGALTVRGCWRGVPLGTGSLAECIPAFAPEAGEALGAVQIGAPVHRRSEQAEL